MEKSRTLSPYPAEYEEWVTLHNGERVFLRPVKSTDGPKILDLFSKLSPKTIYFRFLTHLNRLHPEMLKNLVEIDHVRHFGLVAVVWEMEAEVETIIGVCRYIATERMDHAELTIVLRDDWQGLGLGKVMATRVVNIAKGKGIERIEILFDSRNEGMQQLFRSLGYIVLHETSILDIADRMEIVIGGVNL
jgi:acetyltransferase